MSQQQDIFTELGHAALNARHNNTEPALVSAALNVLLGKLPPRPRGVSIIEETPWVEVAQVAISPEGKMAVLGIESNGRKEIVEWAVINRRWTSRLVTSTDAEMRIDHLHYPEGSKDPAYTVTRKVDGTTRVFWGAAQFDVDRSNSQVTDIVCFGVDAGLLGTIRHCVVSLKRKGALVIEHFKLVERRQIHTRLTDERDAKALGLFGSQMAILHTSDEGQSLRTFDTDGNQLWHSDVYDQIPLESVMQRDGELSFVGWNAGRQGREQGGTFLVKPSGMTAYGVLDGSVFCLKSGRILTFKHNGTGDQELILHEIGSDREYYDGEGNGFIPLGPDVNRVLEIFEIPSGLIIHVLKGETACLLVIHEDYDVVPGVFQIQTSGKVSTLYRWGDSLAFQEDNQLRIIDITDLETWLGKSNEKIYESAYIGAYPLRTAVERLGHTNEGVLSWHFVNGTFYIFRYTA